MKKYVKCFSNGTEAMSWEYNNCDQCNNKACYPKKAIQMGYITGHITWKVAKFIGYESSVSCSNDITTDDFAKLNNKCNHFNKPIITSPKMKRVKNSNELTFQFT